jgi:acyl-CoA reductase-like NAD-dependent aldehyde dehydrogenase
MTPRLFYIGGEWKGSDRVRSVKNPFDGRRAGDVCQASAKDIDEAIGAATAAFNITRRSSAMDRHGILSEIMRGIEARREEFAQMITLETGKPVTLARSEVERSIFTFSIAAEEARRVGGDVLPLDLNTQSVGRFGLVRHFPLGPIGAITPFNFPLNLVAHKIAPAIAAGNTIVLKPSSSSPQVALMLAEVVAECPLAKGAFNVVPCTGDECIQLVEDQRIKLLTFTGSPAVGWPLKSRAGKKRVTLELGGNAGVIVEADADVESAVRKIVAGAFANAGQSCISVQRVFVQQSIWEHARERLLALTLQLVVGDPFDDRTAVGPMITEEAARRIEAWIGEAVQSGGRLLCGGQRNGAILAPSILQDVPPGMKISCLEAFAPVMTIEPYDSFEGAIERVNRSDYGLQAGLFTRDLQKGFRAYEELQVGGVVLNDVPTYRIDHMPYGGIKDSGFGREGVRYAIEEMTELKLLVVNPF